MKQVGIYCRTLNENFFIQDDKVFVKKELAGDVLQAYWTVSYTHLTLPTTSRV